MRAFDRFLPLLVPSLFSLLVESCLCFSPSSLRQQQNRLGTNHFNRKSSVLLRGISEWRDVIFDFPGTSDDRRIGKTGEFPKEICILPFPFTDILLQGETKQLRLYEERFIELFDFCMEKHGGVVAMGLLTQSSGIIQTVPICEIEAYNRMEGFGIFVTIRAVGRAKLMDITQQEPFLKAVCLEVSDKLPPNLELLNLAASNIENFMLLLSSMEHRLTQAKNEKERNGAEDDDDDDEMSTEMRRRIAIARLEDRFYDDDADDDEDEEDDDEDDDKAFKLDRRGRFRKAFEVALATDTQGYQLSQNAVVASNKSGVGGVTVDRSVQELSAISWAAFCTEILPESMKDLTYRIQALDCDKLFDRLKLASYMLRQKKTNLIAKLAKAGIRYRSDDDFTIDGEGDVI